MACESKKMEELKLKFKLAMKWKLKAERNENNLRSREKSMNEEIKLISAESDFTSQQLESVKQEISQMRYQLAMIEMCCASEKAKIENRTANIISHKNGFDVLFSKENKILKLKNQELREKEAEREELERQKNVKILELNEQKAKEAVKIEDECQALESECNILKKRNKAIMLRLRRKLIDAEEIRRNLMTRNSK